MPDDPNATQLLLDWRAGNADALNNLIPLMHTNLHQLANKYMRSENPGHTLQATALVNEAFMKLVDADVSWQNRAHFLALAASTMRRILVDHARKKHSDKRGGDRVAITLHETRISARDQSDPDILAVEEVLEQLEKADSRKARVIELSFYGGMTYDEIAEALGISAATVDRELRFAKAWLFRELNQAQ